VTFTVKYFPHQLYQEASREGEDKYEWYKESRYGDSEEKMKMYTTLMTAYGISAGIDFEFGGVVANTLDAHRVIQHYQEKGPETADRLINGRWKTSRCFLEAENSAALYSQYFEHEQHLSTKQTLLTATAEAGISEADAKAFIEDRSECLQDAKMLIREQAANGVDRVPYIVLEGKRRDVTLVGAEVEEYEKALGTIFRESN
jgi:predicted DsbA family dithiol-disulfide isomerase